jgi:hypothetical protein
MRGNIFGVLALGTLIALLPLMFDFESTDSVGEDFVDMLAAFTGPVLISMFVVACAALVVNWMWTDRF